MPSFGEKIEYLFEKEVRSQEDEKTIRKIESGFKKVGGKWVKDPKFTSQKPPKEQKPF